MTTAGLKYALSRIPIDRKVEAFDALVLALQGRGRLESVKRVVKKPPTYYSAVGSLEIPSVHEPKVREVASYSFTLYVDGSDDFLGALLRMPRKDEER